MAMFIEKCQHPGCHVSGHMDKMASCNSWEHEERPKPYYCQNHKEQYVVPLSYPGVTNAHKCVACLGKEKTKADAQREREDRNRRYW